MDAPGYKKPIEPEWATDYELWTLLEGSCMVGGHHNPVSVEVFYGAVLKHDKLVAKIYRQAKDAVCSKDLEIVPFPSRIDEKDPYCFMRVPPDKFIAWALSRGYEIPTALKSIEIKVRASTEGEEQAEAVMHSKPVLPEQRGITKQQAITAFDGLVAVSLKNALEDCPAWIEPALESRGTPGGRHPTLWNPVMLATCLYDKKDVPKPMLNSAFFTHDFLREWREEWQELTAEWF